MAIAPNKDAPKTTAAPKQDLKQPVGLDPTQSLKKLILSMKDQLAAALPKHLTPDRIARIAMTAVSATPKLAECTQESFLGALLTSAQLGLEPNTKLQEAFLIPYERSIKLPNGQWKKILEVQFQLGYRGITKLCNNSGIYSKITMNYVLKHDLFDYAYGLDDYLKHKRGEKDVGEATHFYALYKTVQGGSDFKVWSYEKALEHGQRYSKSYDSDARQFRKGSAWADNFDAMAMKSVLIDTLKLAPKSVEVQRAIAAENAVIRVDPSKQISDGDLPVDISFDHLGNQPELTGQAETMRIQAEQENEQKEKVRKQILTQVEERLAERIKGGMDIVEFEKKIGMSIDSINDLDSNQLMTVIELLGKP